MSTKINGYVGLHDKYQVELKFIFPIESGQKINNYHIDSFFFLPRNLAVNRGTYSGERFYRNMYEYIRFQTPVFSMKEMADPDNKTLFKLRSAIYALSNGTPASMENYIEHLKMFCSIVKSVVRDGELTLHRLSGGELGQGTADYLDGGVKIVDNFRKVRKLLEKGKASPEQLELFDWVDEFIGITVNMYRYRLFNQLKISENPPPDCRELKKRISLLTAQEIKYRKNRKYPSVPDPDRDNSELLYRESTLKKAMASILYLKVEPKKAGIWLENFFYGLAAAVAMSAALGILFVWKGLSLGDFSIAFFILYVVSYILREQIKRSMQGYFSENRSRYSCDYKKIIRDNMNRKVGSSLEKFGFCDEKALSREILHLRNRSALSKLENESLSEEVLEFRKDIEIESLACKHIMTDFKPDGVVDIMRFNVRDFLTKMDNPVRKIFCPDPDDKEQIMEIRAHRVYHVNLILRYGADGFKDEYARYRLVLARNGIRSIEPIELSR